MRSRIAARSIDQPPSSLRGPTGTSGRSNRLKQLHAPSERLERHRRWLAPAALDLVWLGVSTWLALAYSGRIRDWSVMTDELLYAEAGHVDRRIRVAASRGGSASVGIYSQLYPLLIAPFYGSLPPADAFRAAHVLNAFVMASAAFPAYLLGRQVLPGTWSLGVAVLSVLTPWMALTGFLMTEWPRTPHSSGTSRAPAGDRRTESPARHPHDWCGRSGRVCPRTVFVTHSDLAARDSGTEVARAVTTPDSCSIWRKLTNGLRLAVERHRLLTGVYAIGAVVAAIVPSPTRWGVFSACTRSLSTKDRYSRRVCGPRLSHTSTRSPSGAGSYQYLSGAAGCSRPYYGRTYVKYTHSRRCRSSQSFS